MKNSSKSSGPPPEEGTVDTAARKKKINAALTLGDLFYENGEYDNAVKTYTDGLQVDRSNAELQSRIKRAQRAKATEESINP